MYLIKIPEGHKKVTEKNHIEKILAMKFSELVKDINPHIPESKELL